MATYVCKRCENKIRPHKDGIWLDETDGDGCADRYSGDEGVHEPLTARPFGIGRPAPVIVGEPVDTPAPGSAC
jgi:hypothetical protein